MSIIRIIVILLLLLIAFAGVANADETINTDTNTNIQNAFSSSFLVAYAAQSEGFLAEVQSEPAPKTEEELKNEKILAKWKAKQEIKWKNLPKDPFTINASAYTAAADECGKSDGITSSGIKAQSNRTIACPPEFPFGAKIAIEGMGTFVCEDRGGAIKGNKIDIFMETKGEAFAFGRRNLTAQVVLE